MFNISLDCDTCGKVNLELADIIVNKGGDRQGYFYTFTCPQCDAKQAHLADFSLAELLGFEKMSVFSLAILEKPILSMLDEDENISLDGILMNDDISGLKKLH